MPVRPGEVCGLSCPVGPLRAGPGHLGRWQPGWEMPGDHSALEKERKVSFGQPRYTTQILPQWPFDQAVSFPQVKALAIHMVTRCLVTRKSPCAFLVVVAYSLSHVQLFATPWTVARQAPLSMGFLRQEYWSGLPCPPLGDHLNPGIEPASPGSPALQADSLPLSHHGSPPLCFPASALLHLFTLQTKVSFPILPGSS